MEQILTPTLSKTSSNDFECYKEAQNIVKQTLKKGSDKIDFACISDIRWFDKNDDNKDAMLFGYNYKPFDVLPWIQYQVNTPLGDIWGQLFMIGIKSSDIANNKILAQKLFIKAVEQAIAKGAKTILLATNTKAIFGRGKEGRKRLAELFPDITFVLGDNLVVYFVMEQIKKALKNNGIDPRETIPLIIAPRSLIAENLIQPLKELGCPQVGGLINPRKNGSQSLMLGKKYDIIASPKFSTFPNTDLVITCGSQDYYRLNKELILGIKKHGKKMIIIDPSEPANITPRVLKQCLELIDYHKAGNGYNPKLNYILGKKTADILGMPINVTWGCFSETICLTYLFLEQPEMRRQDWFGVFPEKVKLIGEVAYELGFLPATYSIAA